MTAAFGSDHRRIEELLCEITQAASASDLVHAGHRFAVLAADLRRHMEVENRLLFTPFEKSTGMVDSGPTVIMRREHREIEQRLRDLQHLLGTDRDAKSIVARTQELKAILDDHCLREESALYPTCDRLLDSAQANQAVRELQRERPPSPQPHLDRPR